MTPTTKGKTVRARLVLADGTVFEGESFGYSGPSRGEVVFNTGMTGYPQSLTDPSYRGQILAFTYPLIGNYGVTKSPPDPWGIPAAVESDRVQVSGLIVSDYCAEYSHYAARGALADWLTAARVPAITGIDTRRLTQVLRSEGTMRGRIEVDGAQGAGGEDEVSELVPAVSTRQRIVYEAAVGTGGAAGLDTRPGSGVAVRPPRIALIDCGVKYNIIRELLKRGATVIRLPWDADLATETYDGILVSNGPGDPKACSATIGTLRRALREDTPIFGICLGNQLLALAAGADTYKLPFGHRSQNQPCIEAGGKRCYITSQNHGYAVREDTLPSGWEPWFSNANDGTNEGVRATDRPFCAVQFHPEAAPGPHDSSYLFDVFLDTVRTRGARHEAQGGRA